MMMVQPHVLYCLFVAADRRFPIDTTATSDPDRAAAVLDLFHLHGYRPVEGAQLVQRIYPDGEDCSISAFEDALLILHRDTVDRCFRPDGMRALAKLRAFWPDAVMVAVVLDKERDYAAYAWFEGGKTRRRCEIQGENIVTDEGEALPEEWGITPGSEPIEQARLVVMRLFSRMVGDVSSFSFEQLSMHHFAEPLPPDRLFHWLLPAGCLVAIIAWVALVVAVVVGVIRMLWTG